MTLSITAFVCVRNGNTAPRCLNLTLKLLDFCERIIVLDDSSWDGSVATASKYTDEIYAWDGPDSMADRRNYCVGFRGNDRHTPKWPELDLEPIPEITSDWVIYLDDDEHIVQGDHMPPIKEEMKKFTESDMEGGALILYNIIPSTGEIQTTSPLLRMFKAGTVWWDGDIQHNIHHGQPCGGIAVQINHYGYGDLQRQDKKFHERLPNLQKDVDENPNNRARRRYLINNLAGIVQNENHLEELIAQFYIYKEDFLEDEIFTEDECALLQATTRHFWHGMQKRGKYDEFEHAISDLIEYIWWVPDVWMWKIICASGRGDMKAIIGCANMYFYSLKAFKDCHRSIEMESVSHQDDICRSAMEALMSRNCEDMLAFRAYLTEAVRWDSKYRSMI